MTEKLENKFTTSVFCGTETVTIVRDSLSDPKINPEQIFCRYAGRENGSVYCSAKNNVPCRVYEKLRR